MRALIFIMVTPPIIGVPTSVGAQESGFDEITATAPSQYPLYLSLQRAIILTIKPRWQGKAPAGDGTDKLVTILRFHLNRDGTLAGDPEIVRQEGVTDANRPQARHHAEQAIRAVRLAAPFKLPVQYFDLWRKATIRFDQLPQEARREKLTTQGFVMTFAVNAIGRLSQCKIVKYDFRDDDLRCDPHRADLIATKMLPQTLVSYQSVSLTLAIEVERSSKIIPRQKNEDRAIITSATAEVSADGTIAECKTEIIHEWMGESNNICGRSLVVGAKEFGADPEGKSRKVTVSLEISGLRK